MLAETVESVTRGLGPRDRDIFTLHLQGYEPAEISAGVGRAQRTVRRTLELIRKDLERRLAEPASL